MSDNNSSLRNNFLATGWSSITSPSIVRDCGLLVADIYYLSRRLGLVAGGAATDEKIEASRAALLQNNADVNKLRGLSHLVARSLFEEGLTNRRHISAVYDLVKHLQSFHSLISNPEIIARAHYLLGARTVFVHKDSVGIRIDLPRESEQLTNLHQEFHSFPFGTNGLVLWIPLTRIDLTHGTLGYYPRPHALPPLPFSGDTSEQQRLLAEGRLQEAQKAGGLQVGEEELGQRRHLEVEPGHCYLFSAVLPHESIPSDDSSMAARITCQARLFDVDDPFFQWKQGAGRFWEGLKQPTIGWQLWKDFGGG